MAIEVVTDMRYELWFWDYACQFLWGKSQYFSSYLIIERSEAFNPVTTRGGSGTTTAPATTNATAITAAAAPATNTATAVTAAAAPAPTVAVGGGDDDGDDDYDGCDDADDVRLYLTFASTVIYSPLLHDILFSIVTTLLSLTLITPDHWDMPSSFKCSVRSRKFVNHSKWITCDAWINCDMPNVIWGDTKYSFLSDYEIRWTFFPQ